MIVISDANVIVYLWKGNLLGKVLNSVEIAITNKIFNELTKAADNHTIPRDYPVLVGLIRDHRYNHTINPSIEVIDINELEITIERHLQLHTEIFENKYVDDGELEGIFLSIVKNINFVTADPGAIEYYNEHLEHNANAKAESFEEFLNELEAKSVLSKQEITTLLVIKNN
ncbi:MAG: hypothetical protein KAR20_12625 [Candidatus Heimdallarchaeota archaeon]|nr:hypothetical protein [Candidatus Heimdallarchaeota archaeon]